MISQFRLLMSMCMRASHTDNSASKSRPHHGLCADLALPSWQQWPMPGPRQHLHQRSTLAMTVPESHLYSQKTASCPARHVDALGVVSLLQSQW